MPLSTSSSFDLNRADFLDPPLGFYDGHFYDHELYDRGTDFLETYLTGYRKDLRRVKRTMINMFNPEALDATIDFLSTKIMLLEACE